MVLEVQSWSLNCIPNYKLNSTKLSTNGSYLTTTIGIGNSVNKADKTHDQNGLMMSFDY